MLDTIKLIETPEGVELKLTCVSFFARGIAWLLDILIQFVVVIAFIILLPQLGDFGMGLLFVFLFFLHWLYPVFFEIYMQGQTPGKKVMKIQVVLIDGTMLNWGSSLVRNLLRTVDFLPFLYALGVMTMLFSKDFRRLGDLAANTLVIYKRELKPSASMNEEESIAPDVPLSAIEQQIIVSYAERLHDFSPQRAEELALLASPLLQSLAQTKEQNDIYQQSNPASKHVLAIANHLMGRR